MAVAECVHWQQLDQNWRERDLRNCILYRPRSLSSRAEYQGCGVETRFLLHVWSLGVHYDETLRCLKQLGFEVMSASKVLGQW
jgi:hypothetical protein